MTWRSNGDDASNSVTFVAWKCGVCNRTGPLTTGSPPATPCVCSPGPRKGKANKGRVRR